MASMELEDVELLQRARALWSANQPDQALAAFAQAVQQHPHNVRALVESARAFGQRYEITVAEDYLERTAALGMHSPEVALRIAQSYKFIQRPAKAVAALQQRLNEERADSDLVRFELALLYERFNRIEEAAEMVAACRRAKPHDPALQLVDGRLQRRLGNYAAAEAILRPLSLATQLPIEIVVQACGQLCELLDHNADFTGAIEAIERGKSLLRNRPDVQQLLTRSARISEAFRQLYVELDESTIGRWLRTTPAQKSPCRGLGHLLGFPRSGTTLLEQALAAHPQLLSSSETAVLSRDIFHQLYRVQGHESLCLAALDNSPRDRQAALRQKYFSRIEALLGQPLAGRFHLDKNPNHTSLIAGIIRLLPESRFIVMIRDPRDVVVSTYLRHFPLTEFSANYLSWPTLCRLYQSEMGTWLKLHRIMQGNWIEVKYEDAITDLEQPLRRCLELFDLPWDPAVLDYQKPLEHKYVNSPSHESVRQPIYSHAIARWRNYQQLLEPSLDQLQPFIEAFGYDS